ncbi:MAG: phage minor head protein [Dehalococcoidales bacterium]|nr:phage minor head protein [Dehalococcoidales bacterium]
MMTKDKELLRLTEAMLNTYIGKLTAEYQRAYREMRNTIYDYVEKYAKDGKLTRTEMYKYARFQRLQVQLLQEIKSLQIASAPQVASYLTDQYMLNYFYSGYILETGYQAKLAYGNIPRKEVYRGVLTPMTKISLKSNREAVQRKIQSSVIQSIAQGEGVSDLTARIKYDLERNANDALRIARTETTRVQNWAKQDSYEHAAARGLPVKKRWVATLDSKTRDRHANLDGETVDTKAPFSNGLMFPGDQGGPPEEVINCRCSMVTVVSGYDNAYAYRRARGVDGKNEVVPYKTYREWEKNRVS